LKYGLALFSLFALMVAPLTPVAGAGAAARCEQSVSTVTLKHGFVVGGQSTKAVVKLKCAAKPGLRLKVKGFAGTKVPSTLKVKTGHRRVAFTVRSKATSVDRSGKIVVKLAGKKKAAKLGVLPPCRPTMTSLAVAGKIAAGGTSTGSVRLSCTPARDVAVSLQSTNSSLGAPSRATVPAGSQTGKFTLRPRLTDGYVARLTAKLGSKSKSAAVTVTPGLVGISLDTSFANDVRIELYLSGPAPEGGLRVKLASSSTKVRVPDFELVSEFGTGSYFEADVRGPISADALVTITASLGGRAVRDSHRLVAPFDGTQPITFTLREDREDFQLFGLEQGHTLDVGLQRPAPATPVPVRMSFVGANTALRMDTSTRYISEGYTSESFDFETLDVTSTQQVTLEVIVGAQKEELALTIHPRLTSLTLPASVASGSSVTGTATLAGPASVDLVVSLSPRSGSLTVPRSVTIPAGSISASFTVQVGTVESVVSTEIQGQLGQTPLESNVTMIQPG
jgi:trimeric autotransporter adhesin